MKRLKIAGIVLALVVLLPILAVTVVGGPIARSVVTAVNDNLQTELRAEAAGMTFWSTFPNVGVELDGVRLAGSDGSELLEAAHVRFQLSTSSLFGKITIREIVVQDGGVQILNDVDGNTNYQLVGYEPAAAMSAYDAKATEFAISQARFEDMRIVYRDERLNLDVAGFSEEVRFSGDFGSDDYVLSTDGEVFVNYLDQAGERFLNRQMVRFNANTNIDNAAASYELAPLRLELDELVLDVFGDVVTLKDGFDLDLELETSAGSLGDLLRLIPPAYVGALQEWNTKGALQLNTTINGIWADRSSPLLTGRLQFREGRVRSPRTNLKLNDLNVNARFEFQDGDRQLQNFYIDEMAGSFRGRAFAAKMSVEGMENPLIDLVADGAFALDALPALLGEGPLTAGGGFVRLEGVRVRGRYEDLSRPRGAGRVRAAGRFVFDDGRITVHGRDLRFPGGALVLRDNELELQDFAFRAPETAVNFTGSAFNLIPVLLADELNSDDAELRFEATLRGSSLDLDELIRLAGPTETEAARGADAGAVDSTQTANSEQRTYLSDLLRGSFTAELDTWNYGEIRGESFNGQLRFSPGHLDVEGVTTAMGGELQLDGAVEFTERLLLSGTVLGADIDVTTFFEQAENFAQDVLTADNLAGNMSTRVKIEAAMDETGSFDFDALRVLAHVVIDDGELRDFDLLEDFAFALKSGDLERVRFTRLENYFEIKDQTLFIPAMTIQSSALNLELSGSHTFDQYLNYFIKVNAGQAIANKIARHDGELEVLPQRRGWFNMFFTLKGHIDTFEVERQKREVKRAFEESLVRRGRIAAGLREG